MLKLTIDRQNKRLVQLNGTPTVLPAFYQYNQQALQLQFVDPLGGPTGSQTLWSIVNMAGIGLRVGLWPTPTGSPGGPATLALETTWTWDSTNKWFTGSLDLSAGAIETYIAAAPSKSADFEITIAGNRETLLQVDVLLRAVGDEGVAVAPTPVDTYYTKAEQEARYQKKVGDPGQNFIVVSPGSIYAREFGVDDTGTRIDNIITL